jgi:hypothetical protein
MKIANSELVDPNPGAPHRSTGPKWSPTPNDGLLLPSGKTVGAADSETLRSEFSRLSVPGFNHSLGRNAAIELYANHLAAIGKAGADAAVAAWLQNNRG